jgi:hypothetical protein
VAPLSARDTLAQQDAHICALAVMEAAALGLPIPSANGALAGPGAEHSSGPALIGGLLVTGGGGSRERVARWTHGALAQALEERQRRIR